jgi:signal transduction histidine kinase
MTCMKMDLARLLSMLRESLFPRDKMEEKIRSMNAEVDTTIAEVQRLAAELRPGVLDDLGLVAAIEWQCQDFERRSGIRCLCEASFDEIRISPARATAAFRICQEALVNVARHAKATFVRVLVKESGDDVLIEIQDNGQGIPAEKVNDAASLGLLGMKERSMAISGRLEIAGWPGKGTTVTLRLRCQDA